MSEPLVRPPAGPADLELLWAQGERLAPATLPAWLSVEDAGRYRRLRSLAALADRERERLEEAGLIVDGTGVYLPDPTLEPVFSIGVFDGESPTELTAAAANPVLTRDDVSDVVASYVADPFLLRADGAWHMFFEVWNWRANKGEIGHATSANGLHWSYDRIVLAEEFHLSYPVVFEHAGERWLVPESFQAGGVRLYRADPFPGRWTHATTLLEADYVVDASPFRFDDRWWLVAETSPQHDTLRLFHAPDLLGPWTEHPRSPVVCGDTSRSRPAGRVLVDGTRLIRFAQGCACEYGELVRAFEITALTATTYGDRELPRPILTASGVGWNARGMHHVDPQRLAGGRWLAAVDGWR